MAKDELLDSSGEDEPELRINEKFAARFQQTERLKELRRAKDIDLEDEKESDSEESESEDDDAEQLSSTLDIKIFETINLLRKKDPKIYDKSIVWFQNGDNDNDSEENGNEESDDAFMNRKELKSSKKTYKDVIREQLLSDGPDINDASTAQQGRHLTTKNLVYNDEQEKLRRQFLTSVSAIEAGDDDEIFGSSLPARVSSQKDDDDEKLLHAIDEMKQLSSNEEAEKEQFLADYMKKKLWKAKKTPNLTAHSADDDSEQPGYEEEEEELDEVDKFESKYNFRFEEMQESHQDQGMQVVGHARNVECSLRRPDERRKILREQKKERKEKERRQKEAELRRLKNLKREEIRERLKKIGEIGGLKELGFIDEKILEDDWDPAQHEAMMHNEFNDEYYEAEDDAFQARGDEEGLLGNGEEDLDFDDSQYFPAEFEGEWQGESAGVEDPEKSRNKKRKNRRKGGREEVNETYDYEEEPEEEHGANGGKGEVAQMVEDLYKLDYEDIVAGIPCRFKYQQVEPEDFGLSTEEILLAEDAELNKFLSLKHISAYNHDRKKKDFSKRRKRLRAELKARMNVIEEEGLKAKSNHDERKQSGNEDIHTENGVTGSTSVEKGKKKRQRVRRSRDVGKTVDDGGKPVDVALPESTASLAVPSKIEEANRQIKLQSEKRRKMKGQSNKKTDKKDLDPAAKRLALYR